MQNDRATTVYNSIATAWTIQQESLADQLSEPQSDEMRGGRKYFHCHRKDKLSFVPRRKKLNILFFFSPCLLMLCTFEPPPHNTEADSNNTPDPSCELKAFSGA